MRVASQCWVQTLTDPHQLWLDLNEKCPLLQAVRVAKIKCWVQALTDPHQLWLDLNEKCPLLQAVRVAKSMLGTSID